MEQELSVFEFDWSDSVSTGTVFVVAADARRAAQLAEETVGSDTLLVDVRPFVEGMTMMVTREHRES